MSQPRLPHDFARCHDAECDASAYCWRYALRNQGERWTPHFPTLRDPDDKGHKACGFFIGSEDPEGL